MFQSQKKNYFPCVLLGFLRWRPSQNTTVLWNESPLTWLPWLSGPQCAGVERGLWTWDKHVGLHDLIFLLGSDYHFTQQCGDSVCMGNGNYLWKTFVNCADPLKILLIKHEMSQTDGRDLTFEIGNNPSGSWVETLSPSKQERKVSTCSAGVLIGLLVLAAEMITFIPTGSETECVQYRNKIGKSRRSGPNRWEFDWDTSIQYFKNYLFYKLWSGAFLSTWDMTGHVCIDIKTVLHPQTFYSGWGKQNIRDTPKLESYTWS